MPDIFISYKQEERSVAANLAARLTQDGYDVWWDAALLAGERFEDEISEVLSASRAVIVLWSRKSVHSDWVKAEAESARMQRKVLPTVIDDLPMESLPLLFRGLHVTPLQGWSGDSDHPGLVELLRAVKERVGAAKGPALSVTQAEAKLAEGISEAEIWGAISASADPSAEEYRAYLKRFGPNARFADLAEIRIARIERREREQAQPSVSTAAVAPQARPIPAAALVPRPATPASPTTLSFTEPAKTKSRFTGFNPLLLIVAAVVVVAIAATAIVISTGLLGQLSTLTVPQAVKDASKACTDWSTSPELDWHTGIPALGPAASTDCDTAISALPNDFAVIGLAALFRLEQAQTASDPSQLLDQAKDFANRGVDAKSATANLAMGAMYEHGIVFNGDYIRAQNYFKAAADLGLPRGAAKLCLIWIDRGQLPDGSTAADALNYCKSAAASGDPLGQMAEGFVLQAGYDTQGVDINGAVDLYGKSADQGSLEGKLALGALLQTGNGVSQDYSRALSLFSDADAAGYPEGTRRLGIMYELGVGVDLDVDRAARLYEAASIRGDEIGLLLAAYGLPTGRVPSNRIDAQMDELTNMANNPVSLRLLGMEYEQGYRQTADQVKARQQLQVCAASGNSMCEFALGTFYHYDVKDDQRAVAQFRLAADQGNLYGQYWLGYMLENGLGVQEDTAGARSYYQLAADQGHLTAINALSSQNASSSAAE